MKWNEIDWSNRDDRYRVPNMEWDYLWMNRESIQRPLSKCYVEFLNPVRKYVSEFTGWNWIWLKLLIVEVARGVRSLNNGLRSSLQSEQCTQWRSQLNRLVLSIRFRSVRNNLLTNAERFLSMNDAALNGVSFGRIPITWNSFGFRNIVDICFSVTVIWWAQSETFLSEEVKPDLGNPQNKTNSHYGW
jgi:hypothetical protein